MKGYQRGAARGIAVLLSVFFLAGSLPLPVHAATTQQQIDRTEDEKDELEEKLDDKKEELDGLKDEHSSLKGQLNNLNGQMTQISEKLAELEAQIAAKEQEIADTQASLAAARETETSQYENIKAQIRFLYENQGASFLGSLFSAGSFADFLSMTDYYEQILSYGETLLEEYEATRIYIESEEVRLLQEKQQLDELKAQAEAEKNKVSGLISQTGDSIAQYADQISAAEAEALAYEQDIKKKEEDLEYLRKKLAEEIARSNAAAKGKWRDISEVTFSEGDLKVLANIIYCEAGSEPYEGQLAVGAVVINRVRSSLFPDTVVGVVYQKNQFSPVASGRMDLALASDRATQSCYRAAQEAMSGVTNVSNCVFFRTPVEGLNGIFIGGHVFY